MLTNSARKRNRKEDLANYNKTRINIDNNKSLIVGSIYRPPNSDINYMDKIKSTVDNVLRKNRTSVGWLGGDINLTNICWKTQSIIGHQITLRINSTQCACSSEIGTCIINDAGRQAAHQKQ
jgi:hypothetical protein